MGRNDISAAAAADSENEDVLSPHGAVVESALAVVVVAVAVDDVVDVLELLETLVRDYAATADGTAAVVAAGMAAAAAGGMAAAVVVAAAAATVARRRQNYWCKILLFEVAVAVAAN